MLDNWQTWMAGSLVFLSACSIAHRIYGLFFSRSSTCTGCGPRPCSSQSPSVVPLRLPSR